MMKIITLLVFLCLFNSATYALSATDIMTQVYHHNRGQDSISTLTFYTEAPGQRESKKSYLMLWKKYKSSSQYSDKYLLFQEYPISDKGFAYMGWTYKYDLKKGGESWAYIPMIRSIRQLSQSMQEQQQSMFEQSTDYPHFWLTRSPFMDEHKFIKNKSIDAEKYHLIESHPKYESPLYPFTKTVHLIQKDGLLPIKIDFYDTENSIELTQKVKWKNIKEALLWTEVTSYRPKTGLKIVLKITDIKVNSGLKNRDFTKRMMKSGPGRFKR